MKSHQKISITKVEITNDLEKIIEDIKSANWLAASEISPDDYSVEDLKTHLAVRENIFCVAYYENIFAGMASASIRTKPDGDKWLYIDEVDVCKDMLRKQVGTSLMKFLLDYAKTNNCAESWLGTEVENVAANSLYNSLNPSEVAHFVGYTFTTKN